MVKPNQRHKIVGAFLFATGLAMWIVGAIINHAGMKASSIILVLLGMGTAAVFRR